MSVTDALAALELARGGLPDAQARVLCSRLLILMIAERGGRLREISGALAQLRAPARVAGSRGSTLLDISARVHARRGGTLFGAERLPGPGLDDELLAAILEALEPCADAGPELLGSVHEAARSEGERRRRSTHYTPIALSEAIVSRTLEPLLRSREAAALRVCDPAMGAGAFVLAVCRWIGARLGPGGRLRAALECVRGVDEDPEAVELARLSLWLACEAEALPFDCFDHALRWGDALVGLTPEQLAARHWDPSRAAESEEPTRSEAGRVEQALGERARVVAGLRELAGRTGADEVTARSRLLADFEARTAQLRAQGEGLLAAFFCSTKRRERERARARWLAGAEGAAQGSCPRPCHWWLAFPEASAAGFDAVLGNPPFLGKNGLLAQRGRPYLDWLKLLHPGSHGNADYAAHFFRRAASLVGQGAKGGTIGFVATNTIAQGDTRTTGLARLLAEGWAPYEVEEHLEWPGAAKVTVSVLHLARGAASEGLQPRLSGRAVAAIDSRLRAGIERGEPRRLEANARLAYIGTYLLGQGFVLDGRERAELIAARPANAARILPYLGGEALNSSPTHTSARWAIDFGERSLAEAQAWPELLARVRDRVKPQRDRLTDNPDGRRRKRLWWQHGRVTPSLSAALAPLQRCIVTSLVNKHLCFALVPATQLFSHKLCVFPLDSLALFAVLQSRVHGLWARVHCSTMRNAGINYSPSDSFETFPLPALGPALHAAGERLHRARARFMSRADVGLTKTYNALHDPACEGAEIVELRRLHRAVDGTLLAAYGWDELEPPPYRIHDERFDDGLLERLYALNAERAPADKLAPKPLRT